MVEENQKNISTLEHCFCTTAFWGIILNFSIESWEFIYKYFFTKISYWLPSPLLALVSHQIIIIIIIKTMIIIVTSLLIFTVYYRVILIAADVQLCFSQVLGCWYRGLIVMEIGMMSHTKNIMIWYQHYISNAFYSKRDGVVCQFWGIKGQQQLQYQQYQLTTSQVVSNE